MCPRALANKSSRRHRLVAAWVFDAKGCADVSSRHLRGQEKESDAAVLLSRVQCCLSGGFIRVSVRRLTSLRVALVLAAHHKFPVASGLTPVSSLDPPVDPTAVFVNSWGEEVSSRGDGCSLRSGSL